MSKKNAILTVVILVLIVIAVILAAVLYIRKNGYLYIGDWEDTPEAALAREADGTSDDDSLYTVKQLLEKQTFDDLVEMAFISKRDTLVTVSIVINKKGKYHFWGSTEEPFLGDPENFVLNGDPEQFILFPYQHHGDMVFGWCYTEVSLTVNGIVPYRRTHTVTCDGKEWSLDYFWLDNVPQDTEVQIEYVND